MLMFLVISLGILHTLKCSDVSSVEQYDNLDTQEQDQSKESDKSEELGPTETVEPDTPVTTFEEQTAINTTPNVQRRYWLVTSHFDVPPIHDAYEKDEDEKDANLKSKITTLVQQTLHDTERKLRFVQKIKETHKDEVPYRVGFILSLVKKSKDVINELFNVAVKHRDDWKALEHLKMFEFMVHTNVDTTNLVRQMVETHMSYINSSDSIHHRNRVVLLK